VVCVDCGERSYGERSTVHYGEVVKSLLTAAAGWGMWELVGCIATQVGAAFAFAAAAEASEEYEEKGKEMQLQQGQNHQENKLQEQEQKGRMQQHKQWDGISRLSAAAASVVCSDDSNTSSSSSSGGRANANRQSGQSALSNAAGTPACRDSSPLPLPSIKQLFQGSFWPPHVEHQYLAFKHSELLYADIFTLVYFLTACLSVFSDRPGNQLETSSTTAALLSPSGSRYYMAAVSTIPCILLLLPRLLGKPQYREWFALVCGAAGPLLTVPLAVGWTVPTRRLLEATHITVPVELMSLLFNGFIRPFAYQVSC
jgi:hypothetical protein